MKIKTGFFTIIIFALLSFACTGGKKKGDGDQTVPPKLPPKNDTTVTTNQPPVEADINELPMTISPEAFHQMLKEVYVVKHPDRLLDFISAPKGNLIKIPKALTGQANHFIKRMFTYRSFLKSQTYMAGSGIEELLRDAVADTTGLGAGFKTFKIKGKSGLSIYIDYNAESTIHRRLLNNHYGTFVKKPWGGYIDNKGNLNKKDQPRVYIMMEGKSLYISMDPALLNPMKNYIKASVDYTIADLNVGGALYGKQRKLARSLTREMRDVPFAKKLNIRAFLEDILNITVGGALKNNNGLLIMEAVFNKNVKSSVSKAILKPRSVEDLGKFMRPDTMVFFVDKTDYSIFTRYIKMLAQAFPMFKARIDYISDKKEKANALKLVAMIEDFHKNTMVMMDNLGMSTYFQSRIFKKKSVFSGGFELKDASKAKEVLEATKKMADIANPARWVNLLDKNAKREIGWVKDFYSIRTAKTKILKNDGLIVTITLNWNKIPNQVFPDRAFLKKVESIFGKRLEFRYMVDGNFIHAVYGADWNNEFKFLVAKKGKFPTECKMAGKNINSFGGLNMSQFASWIYEFAKELGYLSKKIDSTEIGKETLNAFKSLATTSWIIGKIETNTKVNSSIYKLKIPRALVDLSWLGAKWGFVASTSPTTIMNPQGGKKMKKTPNRAKKTR